MTVKDDVPENFLAVILQNSPFSSQINPESPALRAGVKKGDRLVELNDENIDGLTFDQIKSKVKNRSVVQAYLALTRFLNTNYSFYYYFCTITHLVMMSTQNI